MKADRDRAAAWHDIVRLGLALVGEPLLRDLLEVAAARRGDILLPVAGAMGLEPRPSA